jgi:hypothetical protein
MNGAVKWRYGFGIAIAADLIPLRSRDSSLHPPLSHGAEKVAGTIRMVLDFAPFGVITEVENAEMIDRFTNAIASADQKKPRGFSVRSGGTNGWRCHIHGDLCLFL